MTMKKMTKKNKKRKKEEQSNEIKPDSVTEKRKKDHKKK